MPMKNRQQRAVIAMMGVAQHASDQPHIGELGQPLGFTIAFVEDILRFDVEAKLG